MDKARLAEPLLRKETEARESAASLELDVSRDSGAQYTVQSRVRYIDGLSSSSQQNISPPLLRTAVQCHLLRAVQIGGVHFLLHKIRPCNPFHGVDWHTSDRRGAQHMVIHRPFLSSRMSFVGPDAVHVATMQQHAYTGSCDLQWQSALFRFEPAPYL